MKKTLGLKALMTQTLELHIRMSLPQIEVLMTLMRTSMGWGGASCTSCTTSSPLASHATAAGTHNPEKTNQLLQHVKHPALTDPAFVVVTEMVDSILNHNTFASDDFAYGTEFAIDHHPGLNSLSSHLVSGTKCA